MGQTKAEADTVKLSVVLIDIKVSERGWREMCARNGISLEGVVVGTHIANSVKQHALGYLASLGFPQEGM